MYNSFISQEKDKEQSLVVIAREHVGTQTTQGTLTCEHARHENVIM